MRECRRPPWPMAMCLGVALVAAYVASYGLLRWRCTLQLPAAIGMARIEPPQRITLLLTDMIVLRTFARACWPLMVIDQRLTGRRFTGMGRDLRDPTCPEPVIWLEVPSDR